ncbi:4983_t:CDS:2, partial [Acaulospora morrowiae]
MSKFNPLYTIIVTVIGGRYFAHNPDAKLYVECRFTDDVLSTISPDSNSILSTDKVEQVSFPIWDTELAWEVDQKTLHTLRSQWAHLKLQCFSVNSNGGSEL